MALRYHSSNPDKYVVIGNDCLVVPINCMDEISPFGTDLGGKSPEQQPSTTGG